MFHFFLDPQTDEYKDIAKHFSYHPNYISTLLHRETGKSFSKILLEQRMERAVSLLKRLANRAVFRKNE